MGKKELVYVKGEEFVRKILDGERDFSGIRLEPWFDLNAHPSFNVLWRYFHRGMLDSEKNPLVLNGSRFIGLKAQDFDVDYLQAEGCLFDRTSLKGSKISDCNLRNTVFSSGSLENAYISGNLEGVLFRVSRHYKYCTEHPEPDDIIGGVDSRVDRPLNLERAHFEGNLKGVDFGGDYANMAGIYLKGDLRGVKFYNQGQLEGAVFKDADLRGASIDFVSMDVTTSFVNCDLRGVNMHENYIKYANFVHCIVNPKLKELYNKLQRECDSTRRLSFQVAPN